MLPVEVRYDKLAAEMEQKGKAVVEEPLSPASRDAAEALAQMEQLLERDRRTREAEAEAIAAEGATLKNVGEAVNALSVRAGGGSAKSDSRAAGSDEPLAKPAEPTTAGIAADGDSLRPTTNPLQGYESSGHGALSGVSIDLTRKPKKLELSDLRTHEIAKLKDEVRAEFAVELDDAKRRVEHRESLLEYVRQVYYRDVFQIREHLFHVKKGEGQPVSTLRMEVF